jgi:hypothetical protein
LARSSLWFVMEFDSPSARSSTDNLQYNAVILQFCEAISYCLPSSSFLTI